VTTRHRASEDPETVIGLIYRIVDEPRRAFTLAVILLPVLASVVQITGPTATLAGFATPAVWWSGTEALGLGWLARACASSGPAPGKGRSPATIQA
jgi:hypothetical protein